MTAAAKLLLKLSEKAVNNLENSEAAKNRLTFLCQIADHYLLKRTFLLL